MWVELLVLCLLFKWFSGLVGSLVSASFLCFCVDHGLAVSFFAYIYIYNNTCVDMADCFYLLFGPLCFYCVLFFSFPLLGLWLL